MPSPTSGAAAPAPDEPLPADAELIKDFVVHLARERHLATSTVVAYRRDLSQLAVFLRRAHGSLSRAKRDQLRAYLAQLTTRGYARASIARRVGAIHTFYRWAAALGRVAADPALGLGRPKVVSRLPTVLRPREAAELAEAPAPPGPGDDPIDAAIALRDRAAIELLYGSGLRVGEVAGLTLDRIDLDRARVRVLGKG